MVNRWRSPLLALLLLFLCVGTVSALTVQAVADRDQISAGENLQIQLRIDGSPDGEPDLAALLQSWEILNRSQSSQMQIINGSFSRSVVYNLTLMPKTVGKLIVPPICFDQDCSRSLTITVSDRPVVSDGMDEPLLLETEISPQKIVPQGQLLFKVRLLRRVDLLEGQLSEPQPTGVAVVVKKLGDDRSYEVRRAGRLYQVIERAYAIFPQGTGTLSVPALQFDGSIAGTRSRLDPFGQRGKRVRRTSQPLQIEVIPFPADLGRRPWIAASELQLQDDWQQQPPKLTVGEPATRTLRLSAAGFLSVQLPELNPAIPDGFKSYPDKPSREDHAGIDGIRGVLVQKIALVPTRAGRFQMPAVDLDWWDTAQGKWRHAHLAPLSLEVAPAAGIPTATTPGESATGLDGGTEGGAIQLQPASSDTLADIVIAGFWPWLSLVLGLGWLLTTVFLLRKRSHSRTIVQPSDVTEIQPTEKAARRSVIIAARSHDPRATRQALIVWSRVLWPSLQGGEYDRLHKQVEPVLRKELENLDLCLYGRSDSAWDGEKLAEVLSTWHPAAAKNAKMELPDLYPE